MARYKLSTRVSSRKMCEDDNVLIPIPKGVPANLRRFFAINDVGLAVVEFLEAVGRDVSADECVAAITEEFAISDAGVEVAQRDTACFLEELWKAGIVEKV